MCGCICSGDLCGVCFRYPYHSVACALRPVGEQIINMVVNPTDQNTRISASKVLTKALMDLFASQHPHSTSRPLIFYILL